MTEPAVGVTGSLDRLCYAGESIVDAVRIGGATVAVTSHRVLALTPEGSGPTLQEAALPNVEGVEVASAGDTVHGFRALRYGVYALALVGASTVVNFDGLASVDTPAQTGAGQVVSMAVAMTGLLGLVDDALRALGVGVLVVALLFAALYGYSRDRHLQIRVAGGNHLRLPSEGTPAVADRLGVALEKASKPSDG